MIESIYIIILIYILYISYNYVNNNIVNIKINNINFYVRNIENKEEAGEMLFKIRENLINLVNKIYEDYTENKLEIDEIKYMKYIKRIMNKIYTVKISENIKDSNLTSYTLNKGDEMVFCLRSKIDNSIHNLNDLLYVAIHEIAHIGCTEIGHTHLFKKINKYLLKKAIKYNIYTYKNYSKQNIEYCGINISSNILD